MRRHTFSLIELLIVVGILGALTTLILPMFQGSEKEAKKTVAKAKMKDIQSAFGRFYGDMLGEMQRVDTEAGGAKTNFYLQDIAENGLWPLFMRNHPYKEETPETQDWEANKFRRYPQYRQEIGFGWRGPYLEQDGTQMICTPNLVYDCNGRGLGTTAVTGKEGGQTESSASTKFKIPVIMDPYGGYYRVLCPEARTGTDGNNLPLEKRLRRMVIVCTGPNKKLETTTTSFIPEKLSGGGDNPAYIKNFNADDLQARGDDMILRLMPTAR